MKNITLSIEEQLLDAARKYAGEHNTSLNDLIRKLLSEAVMPAAGEWVEECFALMDKYGGSSQGRIWKRDDLYHA